MALARRIHRCLHGRHRVDVTRAVGKDRLGAHADDELGPGELREERTALTPLGRIGEPEDIAPGILYLASDEASFVTGTELVIDGGMTAR